MIQLVALAPKALTNIDETRVGLGLPRRDVFNWACAIVFLNQLFGLARETLTASPHEFFWNVGSVGVFQIMAWYAVFRLLASTDPAPAARLRDLVVAVSLCCFVFVPKTGLIWVTALGIAVFGSLFNGGDRKLRAAEIVLAALSIQEFWGHTFFSFFALPLLRAEAAVIGTILQAVRPGTVWSNNVITGPSGHGIVVYDGCSSFHNLSVAALCWLTVRNLRDHRWHARDFVTGSVVGLTMVICNMTRLCLMAWNADLYHYWHDGPGSDIFVVGASTAILLISLYGSRPERGVA